MKRIAFISIFFCLLFSCSQNDGYIGPIFGKWQLQKIETNGSVITYDSIFYNFQNSIVNLQRILPYHSTNNAFGFFIHTDDSLTLEIRDRSISYVEQYQLPDTLVRFRVLKLSQQKMILLLNDKEEYSFRKF
ncbi:MAG: lipocalin-like domain-containing protein [Bacteroidales bacterium]|nr:lipocalin-like domain-containing protein [Bacteroidales bacterium]